MLQLWNMLRLLKCMHCYWYKHACKICKTMSWGFCQHFHQTHILLLVPFQRMELKHTKTGAVISTYRNGHEAYRHKKRFICLCVNLCLPVSMYVYQLRVSVCFCVCGSVHVMWIRGICFCLCICVCFRVYVCYVDRCVFKCIHVKCCVYVYVCRESAIYHLSEICTIKFTKNYFYVIKFHFRFLQIFLADQWVSKRLRVQCRKPKLPSDWTLFCWPHLHDRSSTSHCPGCGVQVSQCWHQGR